MLGLGSGLGLGWFVGLEGAIVAARWAGLGF